MNMNPNTPKHFVLQLGALISLYLSVIFLLVMVFGAINLAFPDAANGIWEVNSSNDMVRIGVAMTVVFFPVYLLLTRAVNNFRRQNKAERHILTKWLIYLSLLLGGGALLIDLVVVIMAFLEGEITERFILKALAVLVACLLYTSPSPRDS